MGKEKVSLLKLFLNMMMISAFTFGGGFVIIGMMRKKFCDELHWVSDDEVLDMTAIAQSSPGALAVNSAIIFGYRMAGFVGTFVSVLATVIPPVIIISAVSMIYQWMAGNAVVQIALQVMRAGVGAIITDVVIDLGEKIFASKNLINIVLMFAAFIASWFFKVSSISLILLFIAIGLCRSLLDGKKVFA